MICKNEQIYLSKMSGNGKSYISQPRIFLLKDGDSYRPDFYCKEDNEYIEVSGTRQAYHANKAKYERFLIEYPFLNFLIYKTYNDSSEKHVGKGVIPKNFPFKDSSAMEAIAVKNNVSQRFAYYVSRGERYTDNIGLAFDMAAAFGAKPINYIRPGLRSVFKKHVPAINRKVRAI